MRTTKTQKTGNRAARKRASSRLRRTNDRSVLEVHEDHVLRRNWSSATRPLIIFGLQQHSQL